jgi:hypothetical protein
MSRTAHYSHTALGSVLSSGRLPSLPLTLAFVRACGGDADAWRTRWLRVHGAVEADDGEAAADGDAVFAGSPRGRRRVVVVVGVAGTVVVSCAVGGVFVVKTMSGGGTHQDAPRASAVISCPARPDPNDRPLIRCDDDRFVADVTIPDGTIVRANQRFVKTWEIQNTGLVPWRGRYLQRQGTLQAPGLCTSPARVPVPTTLPGQDVQISVTFTAPSLPGSCIVYWKMTDAQGRLYFPDRTGVYVLVNVSA